MIVPLALGCLLANLAPGAPKFFGSFTGALFTGALPILAVFFVCMGANISLETTPYLLKKGGVLLGVKILCGVVAGLVLGRFLGERPVAGGFFAGLSALAVVAAINDTNGGLYMALMAQYGKPRDVGAYAVMSLESGPFLTMLMLGVSRPGCFSLARARGRHPAAWRRHAAWQPGRRPARILRPRGAGVDSFFCVRHWNGH